MADRDYPQCPMCGQEMKVKNVYDWLNKPAKVSPKAYVRVVKCIKCDYSAVQTIS